MKSPAFVFLCACSAAAPFEAVSPQPNALVSDPSTWGITGRDAASFTWSADAATTLNGNATMRLAPSEAGLARIVAGQKLWAASGWHADAVSFVGKRVRFSADVRTEDAPDGAWLWFRIDTRVGNPSGTRALCNMQSPGDQRLKGTHPFTKLGCVLDVSADAQRFVFGLGLSGSGRAWVGPSTFEVVGEDVPVSPHFEWDPNAKTPSLEPATWGITGRDAVSYDWSADTTVPLNGSPTMRLEPREGAPGGGNGHWAATGGSTDAAAYRGKRVRFAADVRTESVSEGAWLWLRVDGARVTHDDLTTRALCNMQRTDTRLKGTNPFTKLSCVLDVVPDAERLAFGAGLGGSGRAWFGPATLEVVGEDVPVSPHFEWAPSSDEPSAR